MGDMADDLRGQEEDQRARWLDHIQGRCGYFDGCGFCDFEAMEAKDG